MKKILSAFIFILCLNVLQAQDNTTKPKQWAMVTNPAMKGDNGLLLVTPPAEAAIFCMIAHSGEVKNLYTIHSSMAKELPAGNYDLTFWGMKITDVVVEKGKETRIFTGVLNSSVKGLWEVWTTDSVKIYSAGSPKLVALPIGNYIVKVKGAEFKTTINDGKVTMFSFTTY